ncbi:endochitinase A-like [Xenia sp. Carnegie-2017]|uniref:endochitinase A-like n=1 Tax=Xenia sp. Carnegie-2017 TaxID=2897299 RepID=UPI001F04D116|nr:endochitinase A-like [Xenia sp. Carnegie-2017]
MAVRVGGSDNKSQQTVNNPAMKPLAASDAKTSQVTLNQARSTPSPQSIARTIQVGVKRTVTYNPVTSTKNVTVLSRNSSPESLSHINLERLRAKLKTIQHLTGLQSGSLHQMKHVQTLTNPASQNLPSGSNQPAINLVGQTSSSVQHPSKSSTHGITMTTSQAIVKSDQRDIVAPLTNATSKTDLQPVKSSTVVINQPTIASIKSQESRLLSASSAQATAMTVNPTTTSSSTTKTNSAVSLAQRVSKSEKNANESPLDTSISVKSSAMSVVKQGVQTVCKPATHFIQVPGSTKFSTINKSSSQSLSMLNVQSNTKIIGTQSSVPIIRANSLKSRAPSVASSHVPSTTTSVVLTRNLESSAKSDQSVDDSSKSDEEKLAERINSIVKEVVGGQQRTTRQSVRRLVAAAKVAEAQHKISESGEESQDQTTQK